MTSSAVLVQSATFDPSFGNIPFKTDINGQLEGVPELRAVFVDSANSRIAFPLEEMQGHEQPGTCALMLKYAMSVTPGTRSLYRPAARSAWNQAVMELDDSAEASHWSQDERIAAITLAQGAVAGMPLLPENVKASGDTDPAFASSGHDYNYRAARLLDESVRFPNLCEVGYVAGTNNQVLVGEDGRLWVNVYSSHNTLGFHPDLVAAFAKSLIDRQTHPRAHLNIHLGCVLADAHAWSVHQYSDAPNEQSLNIQPALVLLDF